MSQAPKAGAIGWADLTIADAESIRDFYTAVVGWTPSPVKMGDYADYCMTPPGSDAPVAGVCHARGMNASLPPVWLLYITVADLDASIAKVLELGGTVLAPVKDAGGGARYCVIQDPAGAACALFQAAKTE